MGSRWSGPRGPVSWWRQLRRPKSPPPPPEVFREAFRRLQVDPEGMSNPVSNEDIEHLAELGITPDTPPPCSFAGVSRCHGTYARYSLAPQAPGEIEVTANACDGHFEELLVGVGFVRVEP